MCRGRFHSIAVWAALLIVATARPGLGQDDEDEAPQFVPGLVATYKAADGTTASRLDPEVAFAWGDTSPDPRIPAGAFAADWKGSLFSLDAGTYRLHVFAAGQVRIELNGQVILDGNAESPGWLASRPIDLDFGYYPLTIEYRRGPGEGRIALYWQGPQFQMEPLADRYLLHEPAATPDDRFERGAMLTRALRCGACHELPQESEPLSGPSLARLGGHVHREWLTDWLQSTDAVVYHTPSPDQSKIENQKSKIPLRRMPYFGLPAQDAADVADALLVLAEAVPPRELPPAGDANKGKLLFNTLGCLACHQSGELGQAGLFGGGDLSHVAAKRPNSFFAHWLAAPQELNPAHRMPVFKLSQEEVGHLASYLATLQGKPGDAGKLAEHQPPTAAPSAERLARGTKLLSSLGCASCHALPDAMKQVFTRPRKRPLNVGDLEIADAGCFAAPHSAKQQPGYQLAEANRDALAAYLPTVIGRSTQSQVHSALSGRSVLAERNCLGCHARGPEPGLAVQLAGLLSHDPTLAPVAAALTPPSLQGIGDKLYEPAIEKAIKAEQPLRPWLQVRMPRFNLSDGERAVLTQFFVTQDRIPPGADVPSLPPLADMQAAHQAGRRLVTADGFGCTSCHTIGKSQPQKVALNAQGTNLTMLEERIRRPWFDRWVRNPARIVPRMEMPSIKLPVRGVLHDRLDDQLAGVWSVLNTPGFDPPPPNPIRVLRHSGRPDDRQPADVLTDVVEAGPRKFIKPLVVGLGNRHNVLLDLAECRLAAWWPGDTARQRTRGKSWYWELGGEPVWPVATGEQPSDLQLVVAGRAFDPVLVGQFPTEIDWLEQSATGVRFGHRLLFKPEGTPASHVMLHVVQEIAGTSDQAGEKHPAGSSGWRRRLEVTGLPTGADIVLRFMTGTAWRKSADGCMLQPVDDKSRWQVYALGGAQFELSDDGLSGSLQAARQQEQATVIECAYVTTLPVDQYLLPSAEPKSLPTVRLHAVPGCESVQLPLPPNMMPTGLAWRGDGTLLVSSLKGDVLSLRDSDGDGLEDEQSTFADGLAAPYGLAVDGDSVDVINKHALLKLHDGDRDGLADRWETLASGWGHSIDYHDWAVGLPRDQQGNYYVGLPSQQDDRSPAAAHLRGTAIRLVPREKTTDDPRRYSIESISAGLRFPMGLALNDRGDLFATDNQGNYNPFNELNHLQPGRRYGFINKLEAVPGFNPPAESAAIEIPHPWTRSVNGICFLSASFGPFAGHLVGCEYDTRRLVRMSLDRVGETYQGAVYPFSVTPDDGDSLEGPIVCAVSPSGDLYIGNMRDSGWGAGTNTGSIVRVRPPREWPLGIAEVRAEPDGFHIAFTGKINAALAAAKSTYSVESYRRITTPAYGGPDVDRRSETIRGVEVASDQLSVTVRLAEMRAGFVYEVRVKPLGRPGAAFFPTESHYTLKMLPP